MWFIFLYRKPESNIRIQLPQVSKEHCRIDLNENKEVKLQVEHDINHCEKVLLLLNHRTNERFLKWDLHVINLELIWLVVCEQLFPVCFCRLFWLIWVRWTQPVWTARFCTSLNVWRTEMWSLLLIVLSGMGLLLPHACERKTNLCWWSASVTHYLASSSS